MDTKKDDDYFVVEKEWIPKILKTDFKTKDESLFYNYIISPLCNVIIELFPKSIA
jgi:hypothetical protein